MIAVIDVEIQASNPCMPLYPWRAFKNSPSSLRIRNVPKKIGTWNITSVDVQVEYPNNRVLRESAKLVGGVWVCTIGGSNISGRTTNGYTVIASGVDEFGASITDYILGKGDVEILNSNSIIEAGLDANTIKIFNEQPTELNNGDAWFDNGRLVVYQDNTYHYLGSEFIPTNEQIEALNSGITASKVSNYDKAYNKIPSQTFSPDNMLADKAFVNSSVQTATANFRGNWQTYEDIPTNVNDYPEDYLGIKTPTTNDYLVVENYDNNGTWRFKYVGVWSTDGKNGWQPEYQVNETPLTAAQLAALNSGVTEEKLTNMELNITDAQSIAYSAQYAATTANDKADQVEGLALDAWAKANNAETNSIRKYPLVSIGYLPDGMLLLESYQVTILNYGDVELVINGVNSTDGNTARDCILVVENIIDSDIQIDWPYNFHPRTDKETDFVCKANTTNVYWISEYKPNNFVVAGWQETTGGSN